MGAVTFRQNESDAGMEVNPNEYALDVAYSRLLSEKWSAAVALRYIRSDLNTGISYGTQEMYPANAVAADIAAYFKTPVVMPNGNGNWALGFDISNIGTKITYDKGETNDFLPTNFRLGTSFDFPFDDYNKISVSADVNKLLVPSQNNMTEDEYNDISTMSGIFKSFGDAPGGFKEEMQEIMWSLGGEYSYMDQFFVRAGYFHEAANKGNRKYFTAGAGFKLNVFMLDASYVMATSQSNPLDQTLRFSIAFDLDGLKTLTK